MNANIYKLICITNLHAGNGEMNFDVIDNCVEKDPVTQLPTINSSGVKGAFRQYFKELNHVQLIDIFGSENNKSKKIDSQPGKLKFYCANLLARPMRASIGAKAYYMVTSYSALEVFSVTMCAFKQKSKNVFPLERILHDHNYTTSESEIGVEGIVVSENPDTAVQQALEQYIGDDVVILCDESYRNISLPVMARNVLKDGISDNLWYEEVVPHKSVFTVAVSGEDAELLNTFDQAVNGQYIQFGGNASIGYGLCLVERMED